ncbi:helix-turn-helix domain-containing protein [Azospirillum sp. BE72]|uniref:MerR family transcriptional regulator n=1 Tax=Azospirillum sp. BE72 TaxID=2817776 RepID=UPI002854D300|nr:helix-turn-helix domain-containing protein [Azospirillum sp. BE72]MDR6775587.1 Cu(I)-responsive transcriptional regulator [Azospirillum sp. BE72]
MRANLSIGELGKATSTKTETIRFYEKVGILPEPARTSGNYRSYSEEYVRRLTFVRKARNLGFPLETVRALLDLTDQPDRPCAEVDKLVIGQLHEVERKLADLERLREELAQMVQRCRGGSVSDCRIIEALSP